MQETINKSLSESRKPPQLQQDLSLAVPLVPNIESTPISHSTNLLFVADSQERGFLYNRPFKRRYHILKEQIH